MSANLIARRRISSAIRGYSRLVGIQSRHEGWISLLMSTGAVEPSVRWSVVSRHSPSTFTPTC